MDFEEAYYSPKEEDEVVKPFPSAASQLSPRSVLDDDDTSSSSSGVSTPRGIAPMAPPSSSSSGTCCTSSSSSKEELLLIDEEVVYEEEMMMDDDEDLVHDVGTSWNARCAGDVAHAHQSHQNRAEDTVILLDYDDTILASSWLASRQLGLNSPDYVVMEHAEELRVLEACAAKLLSKSIELGDVHLVTNAEEGWIQMTVAKFMPALRPLLPHVSIISARSTFEDFHPSCPRTWKVLAFRQQLNQSMQARNSETRRLNIISLGDSHHEREALQIVASELPDALAKSIKFVERPTLDVLRRQMELVHSCFDYICGYDGDLDLMLSQILEQQQQQQTLG